MGNSFFVPGEQRAAKVNELFTLIATRYDRINDLQSFGLHRSWKKRLVKLAGMRPGDKALDVCCGTGDLAFALAHQGAETIGLDFNEQMLEIAEARKFKAQRAGFQFTSSLTFIRGDAQALPFPANCFDAVTIGYGLRNLSDWERGLAELQRVTKPGGTILALDFGKPQNPFWRQFYFGYLRVCVPWFGRWFCKNAMAYNYVLESLRHFPAQRGIEAKMQELGLVKVRVIDLIGGAMAINYGEKSP